MQPSRFIFGIALTAIFSVFHAEMLVAQQTAKPTSRPVEAIQRVMIISIDGLRPDVLLRAKTPNLHKLFEGGSFNFWAQTVPVAITLPSHTSMLTGVTVERHGITFNDERATTRPFYPAVPTLFEVAKKAGYTTAMVAGKSKFAALAKPGTIDWVVAPDDAKTTDANVADGVGAMIRMHKPEVMFAHFPGNDSAGHAKGWGSPEQFAALEEIDGYIGMVLNAMQTSGVLDSTLIIVSADHGGSGLTHGANDLRSLHIPWIAYGPGIRKNFDLTRLRDLTVHTEDTFATSCFFLGIPLPPRTQGRALAPIMESFELLHLLTPATKSSGALQDATP